MLPNVMCRIALVVGLSVVVLAGDYTTNMSGWMAGALESARSVVKSIHERALRSSTVTPAARAALIVFTGRGSRGSFHGTRIADLSHGTRITRILHGTRIADLHGTRITRISGSACRVAEIAWVSALC